jgi:hypothetical protein
MGGSFDGGINRGGREFSMEEESDFLILFKIEQKLLCI